MTTEADLRQVMETAFLHCRPGGVALFAPDYVRENFQPGTDHGGHDNGARGMRWVGWTWDPDPEARPGLRTTTVPLSAVARSIHTPGANAKQAFSE